MLNVLIIFGLVFISPTFPNSTPKKLSNLEQITEDFFTLARITNAIFLQGSIIRQDLDSQVMIGEFLKVSPKDFHEIMSIDAGKAVSVLKNIAQAAENVDMSKMMALDDVKAIEEDLNRVTNLLRWMEKTPLDENLTSKEFEDSVDEAIEDLTIFERKCSEGMLNSLYDTAKYLKDGKEESDIANFGSNLKDFVACIDHAKTLNTTINAFSLWKSAPMYLLTVDAAKLFFNDVGIVKNSLHRLKRDLDNSKVIWSDETDPDLLKSTSSQILKAIKAHESHSMALEPKSPIITLAFVEPEDTSRVSKDFQSAWFKKHFVRGSTRVKNLIQALEPFQKLSESILKLYEVWKPFNEPRLTKEKRISIENSAEVVGKFRGSSISNGIPYDRHVEDSLKTLEECLVNKPEDGFKKDLKSFDSAAEKYTVLWKFLKGMQGASTNLFARTTETRDVETWGVYDACSVEILRFYEELSKSKHLTMQQVVNETVQEFRKCANKRSRHGISLRSFVDRVIYIEDLKEELVRTVKNFNQVTTTIGTTGDNAPTLPELLKKSNAMNMEKCLRSKNFQNEELEKPLSFLRNIIEFLKKEDITVTLKYLEDIAKVKTALLDTEKLVNPSGIKNSSGKETNPLLKFNNSRLLTSSFGICTIALMNLVQLRSHRDALLNLGSIDDELQDLMRKDGLDLHVKPENAIRRLLEEADRIEKRTGELLDKSPLEMAKIFHIMADLRGIPDPLARQQLFELKAKSKTLQDKANAQIDTLLAVNLDFATYSSHLLDGQQTMNGLMKYFDKIFGFGEKPKKSNDANLLAIIIGVCVGSAFLVIIIGLIIFGSTKKGREKIRGMYMYYFGKTEGFEKRWRYSCFMDKVNGENALLDSVRETNKENMLIALKRGVYVNAYNNFGNTALHAATKGAQPELVEILIRHGADRSLLNVKNRTPEQMVPQHFRVKYPENADKYEQIQTIYRKLRDRNFRIRVPEVFPVSSFRIWPEERTDDVLTNKFLAAFQHIASIETSTRITHCVMKTDANGILETDSLNLLFWIFNGCIIVREQWMADCLQNKKLIEQDYNYLVEQVKFKGVVYDTVLQWSNAMAKSELPYLYGVQVAIVMREYSNMFTLAAIVTAHGGTMLDEFPNKKKYRVGSHPYLHAHLGPVFIIHDGTWDLTAYAKDKMFTFFTEETFIQFMLKREIYKDTSEEPISVVKNVE